MHSHRLFLTLLNEVILILRGQRINELSPSSSRQISRIFFGFASEDPEICLNSQEITSNDPNITLYVRKYSEDSAYSSTEDFPVTQHVSYLLNYDPERLEHQLDDENTWVRNTHEISGEIDFEESPIEPKIVESQSKPTSIPIYPTEKSSPPIQPSRQPSVPSVLPKSHYPKSKSHTKSTKSKTKSKNPSNIKSKKSKKFSSKSKSDPKISKSKFSKVKPPLDVSDSHSDDSNDTVSSSSTSQPVTIRQRYYSQSKTSKTKSTERKHDSTSQSATDDDESDESSDLLSQMPTLKGQYPGEN